MKIEVIKMFKFNKFFLSKDKKNFCNNLIKTFQFIDILSKDRVLVFNKKILLLIF